MVPATLLKGCSLRALGVTLALSVVFGSALGQTPTPSRTQLANSALPVLRASRVIAPSSPGQVLHLAISLNPRDPAGLQAFCDQVSDPRSPVYRQFITPQEVGDHFGATLSDRAAVASYLASKGFKITLVASNGMAILADATVAQAQSAFGTTINQYAGPDLTTGKKIQFRANATALTIPAAFSGLVSHVSGLQTYSRPQKRATTQLLTPPLARALYGTAPAFAGGYHGELRNLAVSNFDGYDLPNLPIYINAFSLPFPAGGRGSNVHVIPVGSPGGGNLPASGEGDINIQMVLGMAPLADIYIYDNDGTNPIALWTQEAQDNIADVITESYGWPGDATFFTAAHNQHLSMTAEGITYMCASGDTGTSELNGPNPYPDFDPEVLMVGGTEATVDSTTGARSSEVGWSGSAGGWSTFAVSFNTLPSWQVGNGVPTGNDHRLVPDIALHASGNSGAYPFVYQGVLGNGSIGTSFASPVCAGCFGILEQRLSLNGGPLGISRYRLGRVQDLIYAQNGRSDVWFDILTGNNGVLPSGASSSAHAGWDTVTGWGAPNFDALYASFFLSGHVTLSSWNGSGEPAPTIVFEVKDGSGTVLQTVSTTLDANGNYSFAPTVPSGTYTITAKGTKRFLRQAIPGVVLNTGAVGVNFTLVNGDVNGDNFVSSQDLTAVRLAFGSSPGAGNWNPDADLNGDGFVGSADLTIVRQNFGRSGD